MPQQQGVPQKKKADPISPENMDPWVYRYSKENLGPFPLTHGIDTTTSSLMQPDYFYWEGYPTSVIMSQIVKKIIDWIKKLFKVIYAHLELLNLINYTFVIKQV